MWSSLPVQACPGRATAGQLPVVTGRRVDRAAFTARLLSAFEARYGHHLTVGFAGVHDEWESYSCLTGREVTIAAAGGDVHRSAAGEVTARGGHGG